VNPRRGMQARPLGRYRKPAYPTRLEVLSRPSLLQRNQPASWRVLPEMAGAVALFLAANATLHGADPKASGKAVKVAPIFAHGEGVGATGCVVVAPPAFLSEEEAWQVIDEELGKQGVKVATKGFAVRGVKISEATETSGISKDPVKVMPKLPAGPAVQYTADRADPQARIALEFVSRADCKRLGVPRSTSSVRLYNLKEVGTALAERVHQEAQNSVAFGVLYDPVARSEPVKFTENQEKWRAECERRNAAAKAESKRLLRLQVQDFVKWLQGQGVI